MTKIIGMLLYYFKRYIVKKYGDDGYLELTKNITAEHKEILEATIVGIKWYNIETYDALLNEFYRKYPSDFDSYHYNLAETFADGFFGFVVKLLSWERLATNFPRLWPTTYDSGKVTIAEIDDVHTIIYLDGITLTNLHFRGLVETIRGWAKLTLKKDINLMSKKEEKGYLFKIYY